MRDYSPITLPDYKDTIKIENIPTFDIGDYDLTDPKDLMRYFINIERICRNSRTYKKLVNFLREYVDMNKCSFYSNINNIDTYSIKIHIHHSPLTLFDIVNIVYYKRLINQESISDVMVAKEVMYNHYRLLVGLIPLSETVHELVHNGYLFIPTNVVYGKYKEFLSIYDKYVDMAIPGLKDTIHNVEEATKEYDFKKETKVLTMNMLYLDTSGAYEFPKMEDIVQSLQEQTDIQKDQITSVQYFNKKEDDKG